MYATVVSALDIHLKSFKYISSRSFFIELSQTLYFFFSFGGVISLNSYTASPALSPTPLISLSTSTMDHSSHMSHGSLSQSTEAVHMCKMNVCIGISHVS